VLIFDNDPESAEKLGSSWKKYYKAFMLNPGQWMKKLDYVYEPEVVQVK